MTKAIKEILNQLDIVKKGEFSDFEFESSIKSLKDSLNTYNDSQASIDAWYSLRAFDKDVLSPEALADKLDFISRDDIVNTAKGVKLHTVYKLMPNKVQERK